MLKVRIIPALLFRTFGLVKGVAFDSWRRVGSLLPAVKIYHRRDVDELLILDIVANQGESCLDPGLVSKVNSSCSVPLTVGGGITHAEQVSTLLLAGADKITINSSFYETPQLVTDVADKFGSQSVTVSIDAKKVGDDAWECYKHSGKVRTYSDPMRFAMMAEDLGAGEILLTSIDRDGTMEGFDIELIESITSIVNIPVIASGGAGSYRDLLRAISDAGASAVAASSMFLFTQQTPKGAREYLRAHHIPVRADI